MHRPIFANPSFFIFAVVAAGCANAFAQPCAPVITQNPHPVGTCTNTATFSVIATSDTPVGYRWQIQTGPTLWQTMTTNPLPLPCLGGMAAADPPFESTTTIMMDPCPGVQVYQITPVSSGSIHDPLPPGDWKVTGVGWHPVFHYNPDLFWDSKPKDVSAAIKPGPNNPVGVVWIALNLEHYGLHGTPEPANIGHTESHGCVRMTNWDAARVAALVKAGTPVLFK